MINLGIKSMFQSRDGANSDGGAPLHEKCFQASSKLRDAQAPP